MKTRLEWRHENKVLKLDDTDYDQFPEDGDVIEMDESGETHRFRVAGVESAVVLLETVPDETDVTPTRETSRARTERRLAAERSAKSRKTPGRGADQVRTFRISPSSKSKPLSKTARGNKTKSARSTTKRR